MNADRAVDELGVERDATVLTDRTLQITVRDGECFPDGTAFDEQVRWESPHPPGTHFNIDRRTRAEVVDDRTVELRLPEVDGLALGKLRATPRDERSVLARPRLRLRGRGPPDRSPSSRAVRSRAPRR